MKVIESVGINDAMCKGLSYLLESGLYEKSRNGRVLVAPCPVTTVYRNPLNRVSYSQTRNANPFFHLMEALWMLRGKNDIAWPAKFNKKFIDYSDDGVTQWGAYGWRWREFFGYDQIDLILRELLRNHDSRRCVLSMWNGYACEEHASGQMFSGRSDLEVAMIGGKDVPCNTHAYFDRRGGRLNMTVCNRSNDAIWGAYGANVVHFSILQEYIAWHLGIPVGIYNQVSNNFHVYLDVYDEHKLAQIVAESEEWAIATERSVDVAKHIPLFPAHVERSLLQDIEDLLCGVDVSEYGFVSLVAKPMYHAWDAYKQKKSLSYILEVLDCIPSCDWKLAATKWIQRNKKETVNDEVS